MSFAVYGLRVCAIFGTLSEFFNIWDKTGQLVLG